MNDVEKPSVPNWQYGSLRGRKNCQCQLVGRPDGLTAVHKSVCARARISIQYFYPFASLQNKARHYPIASRRFVFSAKITSLELIWSQLPALPWTVLQKMMSYHFWITLIFIESLCFCKTNSCNFWRQTHPCVCWIQDLSKKISPSEPDSLSFLFRNYNCLPHADFIIFLQILVL